jgi:hypothetical protein
MPSKIFWSDIPQEFFKTLKITKIRSNTGIDFYGQLPIENNSAYTKNRWQILMDIVESTPGVISLEITEISDTVQETTIVFDDLHYSYKNIIVEIHANNSFLFDSIGDYEQANNITTTIEIR